MPNTPTNVAADTDSPIGDEFKLISIKDAAERRGVTYWQMHQDVEKGHIPSRYQGRRRYVTERDLFAFIANLPTEPPSRDAG